MKDGSRGNEAEVSYEISLSFLKEELKSRKGSGADDTKVSGRSADIRRDAP